MKAYVAVVVRLSVGACSTRELTSQLACNAQRSGSGKGIRDDEISRILTKERKLKGKRHDLRCFVRVMEECATRATQSCGPVAVRDPDRVREASLVALLYSAVEEGANAEQGNAFCSHSAGSALCQSKRFLRGTLDDFAREHL